MRLILLGKPSSGKGTQAKRIVSHTGLPAISTGDLLRKASASGSKLGEVFRSFTDRGQLVPDDLIVELLEERISAEDCAQGFLLDGFPRTLPQATSFADWAARHDKAIEGVIKIVVPDEMLVERAAGRRFCSECGHSYHLAFAPPKKRSACDACDGPLEQREDDKEEVVAERLRVYDKKTAPLTKYYSDLGLLWEVDGVGTPDEVFQRVLVVLERL